MPNSLPSNDPVTEYARDVVHGRIPAGKWHKLACVRHLTDLAAAEAGGPWVFRPDLAQKAFGILGLCRHYKGEWSGERIALAPFQLFIVGSIMGWVDRVTGRRRFRNAFIELPRGNGKSTLAGGLLLLFAFFLNEGGAEAYSVATKKDQARISFQAGRQMLLRSKALSKHVTIGKYNVHNPATESKMEALGADADTLDGLRPFIVVVDEVHKLPSADLVDVMESGMGTRLDPLMFEITTAGKDDQSVYGQHHLLSTRVLDGTVDLPQWFTFIAAADMPSEQRYHSDDALQRMVQLCSCQVRSALVAIVWDRHSATQIDGTTVENSANPATTLGSRSEIQPTQNDNVKASGDGPSEIGKGAGQTSVDGLKRTESESGSALANQCSPSPTECHSPTTNLNTKPKKGDAASVLSKRSFWRWITATTRKRCEVFCAENAIQALAISEILKWAYNEHSTTCEVRLSAIEGDALIVQEDDWTRESTWKKANPNYGISVKADFLHKEVKKAIANPAEQSKFRRLYLGQKVESVEAYFSVPDWKACPPLPPDAELLTYPCWLGFDLSSTTDLTAAVLCWQLPNEELAVKPYMWLPEDTIVERGHEDRMPYERYVRETWLRTTSGRTIDRQQVRRELVEICAKWRPKAICADPWQMHELGPQLAEEDKLPVVLVPQRFEKLSEPMKILQGRMIERRIRHDHNPLMTMMVGNVKPREDENGNVRTSKRKSRGRIDGVQALINAIAEIPIKKPQEPMLFFLGGQK